MKYGFSIDNFLFDLNGFILKFGSDYILEKYGYKVINEKEMSIEKIFDLYAQIHDKFPIMKVEEIEEKVSSIIEDFWSRFFLNFLLLPIRDDAVNAVNNLYSTNGNEIYLYMEDKFKNSSAKNTFVNYLLLFKLRKSGINFNKILNFDSIESFINGIQKRCIKVIADNRTEVIKVVSDFADVLAYSLGTFECEKENIFLINNFESNNEKHIILKKISEIIEYNNQPLVDKCVLSDFPSKDKVWLNKYKKTDTKYVFDRINPISRMYYEHIDCPKGIVFKYLNTNKKLSAKEFFDKISSYANFLIESGVKSGDKIPVIALNTFDAAEMIIAILTVGAVAVPITATDSKERILLKLSILDKKPELMYIVDYYNSKNKIHLASIVEDIKSEIGIKKIIYSKLDTVIILNEVKAKLKNSKIQKQDKKPHNIKESSELKEMFDSMIAYKYSEEFINTKAIPKCKKNIDFGNLNIDLDSTAAIVFTSGETPKGVELTFRGIDSELATYYSSILNLKRDEKISSFLPFDHVFGFVIGIMVTAVTGMIGVLDPAFKREKIGEFVFGEDVDYLALIPVILTDLLNDERLNTSKNNKLKKVFCGSQVLSEKTSMMMEKSFPNNEIVDGYGSSEGTCVTLVNGIPIINCDFKVTKVGTTEEIGYNQKGEFCISGDVVFKQYHNNEEMTMLAKKHHKDGKNWYHTGDLIEVNENGQFKYLGRVNQDFIKSNGFQIYLYNIKRLVESIENVRECVVIDRNDEYKGSVPVVFAMIDDITKKNETYNQIIELYNKLEYYEKPRETYLTNLFPMTSRGKNNIQYIQDNYEKIVSNNIEICEDESMGVFYINEGHQKTK